MIAEHHTFNGRHVIPSCILDPHNLGTHLSGFIRLTGRCSRPPSGTKQSAWDARVALKRAKRGQFRKHDEHTRRYIWDVGRWGTS